jgi:hypothetical protein
VIGSLEILGDQPAAASVNISGARGEVSPGEK